MQNPLAIQTPYGVYQYGYSIGIGAHARTISMPSREVTLA